MYRYCILANPGHNRVYFDAAVKMAQAELALALPRLSVPAASISQEIRGGVPYICFSAEQPLSPADIRLLSALSFTYALFLAVDAQEDDLFRPVPLPPWQYIGEEVSGMLKYTGKTNPLFTRLLLNVGLLSMDAPAEPVRALDPVAGKGTTLFEAAALGLDAYGIEIGEKAAGEAYHHMKRYLETEKYKHAAKTARVGLPGETAVRYCIDITRTKEEAKLGGGRHWEMAACDTVFADKLYKKNFFHLLVGDLPYGVQHAAVTNERQSARTRSPEPLLCACLGAWMQVLKPGGVIALSWNTLVCPRERLSARLSDAGLSVLDGTAYNGFAHRVDQSIRRDIIVAKK